MFRSSRESFVHLVSHTHTHTRHVVRTILHRNDLCKSSGCAHTQPCDIKRKIVRKTAARKMNERQEKNGSHIRCRRRVQSAESLFCRDVVRRTNSWRKKSQAALVSSLCVSVCF